ncbi:MAG: S41 family peptidase, partial [bacterium]
PNTRDHGISGSRDREGFNQRASHRVPVVAALLAAFLVAFPISLAAQPSAAPLSPDGAAALVEETFSLIRDHALTAPDSTAVLTAAVAAATQALSAAGIVPPAAPALTATAADLPVVRDYIRAAAVLIQSRPLDSFVALVLRAMVRESRDPLGAIFLPADFSRFVALLRGERGGVGLQVDALPEGIVVVELVDGGPAARGGVLVGDRLADVDGVAVADRTPDEVIELLGGRVGTTVMLTLIRGGQTLRASLTRAQVRAIPIRARLIEPRVGYIRLLEFSEGAAGDLARALGRLVAQGAAAVLLDLRDNGGGLVDESIAIASHFLPPGLVAIEERRAGPLMLLVQPVSPKFAGPVAVLVNTGSASASEIVAGALQDVRTPLVGMRTFGKGTVQTIFTLEGEWGLRLTTGRYRTRAGRAVDGVGLQPDVVVPMADDQVQGPNDVQLAAALQLVRSRLRSARVP